MDNKLKTKENRFRRILYRHGMRLMKGRTKMVGAGSGYMIVDVKTNGLIEGGNPIPFFMSLEDVENFTKELE